MYRFSASYAGQGFLVVEIPPRSKASTVIDALRKTLNESGDLSGLARADSVVLRPPPAVPILDMDAYWSSVLDEDPDCVRRLAGKSIYLLSSYDHAIQISANLSTPARTPFDSPQEIVDRLRDAEMDFLMDAGSAIFPSLANAGYRTPSQRMVKSFVRAGNIQLSRAAIDATFFWLIPHLRDIDGIIVDTWSIGSTALNASRRLAQYAERKSVPIEIMAPQIGPHAGEYRNLPEDLDRLIAKIEIRTDRKPNILALMSTVSSGTLCRELDLWQQEGGEANLSMCCLYSLRSNPPTNLATLRHFGDDERFSESKAAVALTIDPKTFFVPRQIDEPVRLGVPSAYTDEAPSKFIDLVNNYENISELISIHTTRQDEIGPNKHHCVFVDMERLVESPVFIEKLHAELSKVSTAPKFIITRRTTAAKHLGRLAKEKWPDAKLFDLVFIDPNDMTLRAELLTASNDDVVLILDDVFVKGEGITSYQRSLRQIELRAKVHYLVALARPARLHTWSHTAKNFAFKFRDGQGQGPKPNDARFVEFALLPSWGDNKCPWCAERSELASFLDRNPDLGQGYRDHIQNRMRTLDDASRSGGISSDNIWFRRIDAPATLQLSPKSTLWTGGKNDDPRVIFASVLSHLQAMRSGLCRYGKEGQRIPLGPPQGPLHTIIDPKDYLRTGYSESTIFASILRAGRPYELNPTDMEGAEERAEVLQEIVNDRSGPRADLGPEIFVASLSGKTSDTLFKDMAEVLDPIERRLMRRMINAIKSRAGQTT